jgi:pyruvate dehydrogenase E1 component alpha subunit
MYEQMFKIRTFEEHVNELYTSAKMPGLAHLYIGEEAVAVGVCEALRKEDYITSTHRGHGHCLAKGASVDKMFCELLGKAPGYCRGKGGSMHIADQENGNLGANAIVGGSAALATGAAFANKRLGTGRVVVCFFGEGALGQGVLYESMNMAQLWKLPVVYVCENNLYNEYTHHSESTSGSMTARPEAFGMMTVEVDGQNVREVNQTAQQLAERARRGEGPAFMLCHTYRYLGHHVGDINRSYYRSPEEEKEWKTNHDPLKTLRAWLIAHQMSDAGVFEQIEKDVQAEIEAAVEYALNAPYPEPGEVSQHVFV